jgi:hypothetical protein
MPIWSYMENGGTRGLVVAHRRFGKDDIGLHFTATQCMLNPGNYWHMLPQYSQARKVIWKAVNPKTGKRRIDEAFPHEIRVNTWEQDMSIEFVSGSMWQLVGSDTYNSVVGAPPRGIVLSEWALANPMAWPYLEPILEENGGWALFIYTSRGNNHGRTFYDNALKSNHWLGMKISARDTDVFDDEQLDRIRDGLIANYGGELGLALYEQEYECSFEGAVFGAYFAKQMRDARNDGRIGFVPYQPELEVDTAWDLGVDDSMSIWFFQPVGQGFNFIDYHEDTGYGFEHYAKILKEKGYNYGNNWMPHDAGARVQSPGEVAKTPKQMAEDAGIKPITVVQRPRNLDLILKVQIPACRNMIARSRFDEKKCSQGIMGLDNYRAEYNEEKKILSSRPQHDWASHPADAFRTFASGYKEKAPPIKIELPQYSPQQQGWMA